MPRMPVKGKFDGGRTYLPDELREKRIELKIPPDRIATALGCAKHTVRQYERRDRTMPANLVERYRKVVDRYASSL